MCIETIVATDAKRIYIHHWDDFKEHLQWAKPVDWFMNKIPLLGLPKPITDGCGEMVKKFKEDAESYTLPAHVSPRYPEETDKTYLDPKYAEAKRKWEEWEAKKTAVKPTTPHYSEIREFKFLPLFKRIKI